MKEFLEPSYLQRLELAVKDPNARAGFIREELAAKRGPPPPDLFDQVKNLFPKKDQP